MSHTPTPWSTNSPDETLILGPDRQVVATTLQDEEDYQANHDTRYGDAELIVKAVNAHDGLVAALNSIAHTFIENSAGGLSTLPAGEYQRMAREALAKAGLL